jgi:hypothetical protein
MQSTMPVKHPVIADRFPSENFGFQMAKNMALMGRTSDDTF